MKRYEAAASQPKMVRWYESGHDLNDPQTLLDRAAFLEKHIGMKPLPPVLNRIKPDIK